MPLSLREIEKYLASIQPFKALDKSDLSQLAGRTSEKVYAKGEAIYNEGDTADSAWVLHKGRIQVFKHTNEGRPLAIESLAAGELFGTLCRLGGNGRVYPCTAIAAEACVVLRILDRTFLEYYLKNPGFIRGLCSLCSDRLKDVQDLRCMGQEQVPVRIANILWRLYQVHGEEIPFTKKELAELVGATLETTFRTLTDFQNKGLVASGRGKILIKKSQEIKNLAQGC
ncbi:MAG: Crp/Fnr family transcriptional regulator [Elusimicrobia bacterium]|nr:Crp/Fnr family transcriptional regulator [Elusimicrobiota bacterium]